MCRSICVDLDEKRNGSLIHIPFFPAREKEPGLPLLPIYSKRNMRDVSFPQSPPGEYIIHLKDKKKKKRPGVKM